MNELELKLIWQKQTIQPVSRLLDDGLVEQMKKKMRRLGRTLFWRDVREIGACALLIAWVGAKFSAKNSWLSSAGGIVVILSCALITLELLRARRAQHAFLNPASVREFLDAEAARVARQIRLLQSVLWWYVAPLFLGMALMVLGDAGTFRGKALALVILFLVGWFIHWLNQYAVRKMLLPLKVELERTLDSMSEFSKPENHHHPEGSNQ